MIIFQDFFYYIKISHLSSKLFKMSEMYSSEIPSQIDEECRNDKNAYHTFKSKRNEKTDHLSICLLTISPHNILLKASMMAFQEESS